MTTSQSIETASLTVNADDAGTGNMGQKLLVSGDTISLRLWDEQPSDSDHKPATARDYETVGYVIEGRAELTVAGKTVTLEPGVSWVVPKDAEHFYRILEPFRAVEATHPPAKD